MEAPSSSKHFAESAYRIVGSDNVRSLLVATGGWQIDPAEFHRVFPPLPLPAPANPQPDQLHLDIQVALLRNLVEQLRRDTETREEDHRRREQDLRQDRDHWREAFQAA